MNSPQLFRASCLALIVTAMSFAIRADIMGDLGAQFSLSHTEIGFVAGTAFWGFTLAMIFGGPLCDVLGMSRLLSLAFIGHAVGIIVTILAVGFKSLFLGTLAIGIANGLVEAACNPLIATLFPEQKTEKLNKFHVWFPGGIVIGGLIAYFLTKMGLDWRWKMAAMLVPLAAYGFMFFGKQLPKTERVASGVSTADMFKACLNPLFILMVFCMLLTASTELGSNQWIPSILTVSAGFSGILILVWINGLMALGRNFAGPVVHKLSPTGMLLFSAFFAGLGLLGLSFAHGQILTVAAATVFAVGVCYFWPTMLGFTAERFPKAGALGLAIMGGAGMLSVSWILPIMGGVYDKETLAALPSGADVESLKTAAEGSAAAAQWLAALAQGGAMTLRYVAILPAILVVIFGLLVWRDRQRGGYSAVKI